MNSSHILAEFVGGLTYDKIPEHIRNGVDLRIADLIASAAAGCNVNKAMNDVVFRVLRQQSGEGCCSVLYRKEMLSPALAAFYNAFVSNGADMDDGHMLANGHPGVTVIPPVLALAEQRGLSYEEIAAAIVAGYEVYIRLSRAIMPSHLQRGFNGTGTAGSVAAAAAAAKVLGLGAEKIQVAMGLAATSASGLMELNESGQGMKPINPANAAYRGVMCALFAEAGAVGPDAPLDGGKGFFKAFTDDAHPEEITSGLGEEFQLDTAYIKLYPACRHMHAMIDCAAILRAETGAAPEDVQKAVLYTYPSSEKLTGSIRHPKSGSEAKFSLTYATAVALATGGYALKDLTDEAEKGDALVSLIDRMEIAVDPELENRKIMLRGARMEITLKNGETHRSYVAVPKGEKAFPVALEDVQRKLRVCSEGLLSRQQADRVFQASMDFRGQKNLRNYFLMLTSEE